MPLRRSVTAVGSGLASFVLVAGSVVHLLSTQFPSGGPSGRILVGSGAVLGLLLGVAAGISVGFAVVRGFETWQPSARRIASGYAAFGIVFCGLTLLAPLAAGPAGYNPPFEVVLGASLFALAVVHGGYYTRDVSLDTG